jgi:hypothetical protein
MGEILDMVLISTNSWCVGVVLQLVKRCCALRHGFYFCSASSFFFSKKSALSVLSFEGMNRVLARHTPNGAVTVSELLAFTATNYNDFYSDF